MTVFIFCTCSLLKMSFYLRSSWHITLEFTPWCVYVHPSFLCAALQSGQLYASISEDSFCLPRFLEGKGRAEESELPCQRVNFPIQVCTSCLQFALCPRCVLTNQSVSVVLKRSAKCELKCLHCSLLSL